MGKLMVCRRIGRQPFPNHMPKIADNVKITDPALVKKISAALDRKLLEITRVRREIEALIIAMP
jgi:hypothetical protein